GEPPHPRGGRRRRAAGTWSARTHRRRERVQGRLLAPARGGCGGKRLRRCRSARRRRTQRDGGMTVSRLSLTVLLVASLCSGSCASPEPSRTYHFVFDQLVLGVAEPDGEEMVSDGLDLDGSDGPVSLPDGAPNPCSSHGDDPDYVS